MDLMLVLVCALGIFFGFAVSYAIFLFKKNFDELSYNVVLIKEDLVNIQLKLERVTTD